MPCGSPRKSPARILTSGWRASILQRFCNGVGDATWITCPPADRAATEHGPPGPRAQLHDKLAPAEWWLIQFFR
jgi:hypothetical protein